MDTPFPVNQPSLVSLVELMQIPEIQRGVFQRLEELAHLHREKVSAARARFRYSVELRVLPIELAHLEAFHRSEPSQQ